MNKTLIAVIAVVVVLGIAGGLYMLYPAIAGTNTDAKMHRVGILSGLEYFAKSTDGFKQKMTELGYIEGKNIIYDIQKTDAVVGNQARLKKMVDDGADLLVVFPTEPSIEAAEVTKDTGIPVISLNAVLEGTKLVANFQRPGGNVTGVRYPSPEISARRLEVMHELVPNAKRYLIPHLKDYPSVPPALAGIEPVARSLGITVIPVGFVSPQEMESYLKDHVDEFDVILEIPEPLGAIPDFNTRLFAFAHEHNIPAGGSTIAPGDGESLFLLAHDPFEAGELAAPLADKMYRGTPAGNIPIVTPEPRLSFNYSVAQRLGLTVSESFLAKVDEIVR